MGSGTDQESGACEEWLLLVSYSWHTLQYNHLILELKKQRTLCVCVCVRERERETERERDREREREGSA